MRDDAAIPRAFDEAEAGLGAPVDLLFNNAGVLDAKRFIDQDMTEVDRIFDAKLRGAFRVAQGAARRMVKLSNGARLSTSPPRRRSAPAPSSRATAPPRPDWCI